MCSCVERVKHAMHCCFELTFDYTFFSFVRHHTHMYRRHESFGVQIFFFLILFDAQLLLQSPSLFMNILLQLPIDRSSVFVCVLMLKHTVHGADAMMHARRGVRVHFNTPCGLRMDVLSFFSLSRKTKTTCDCKKKKKKRTRHGRRCIEMWTES